MSIRPGTRIHFMGIGGIGMSGLATICLERGCLVSGCDAKLNGLGHRLQAQGASIAIGHDVHHLDPSTRTTASGRGLAHLVPSTALGARQDSAPPLGGLGLHEQPELVVYSAAVNEHEPELLTARSKRIRTISRGELLAELTNDQRLIAVAGAHGKTTTSGMAAELLQHAGWDPLVAVGGLMRSTGTNAHAGRGVYAVAETDESDGSFLHLWPEVAIVTNIDREHLNYYHSFEHLVTAFEQFVGQLKPHGTLIRWYDDELVRRVLSHPSQLGYGLSPDADVTAQAWTLDERGSQFRALYKGRSLGTFRLQVPGRHNILNGLAIISLGLVLDLPMVVVREALAQFQGTERRFQVLRLPGDIWLVEDYAHHPSEIQATLAADTVAGRHRIAVFQPHRFSRTQSLEREFTTCFSHADSVIVTDIYPAFESPIPGVSGERLAGLIKACGHPWVRYVPKQELTTFVSRIAQSGDTFFFLGAGDIGELCHDVAAQLHSPARATR